jgi:hypothetical protein
LFLFSPYRNNQAVVSFSSFASSFSCFSLYHSNLGAVVSFFGALLGSAVIYIIPGMMYRRAREAQLAASGSSEPMGLDYRIAGGLIPAGWFLSILGATIVVLKATTNILK